MASLLLLSGCDALPRDVAGTTDRVTAGTIRVGVDAPLTSEGTRFLDALKAESGATPILRTGSLEALIDELNRGALDVIVAPVRSDALLAGEVALGPPLDGSGEGDKTVAVRALARNGEHRWIMTMERASRRAGAR